MSHRLRREFASFPATAVCPLCGTSENSPSVLMPIAGTENGKLCEAAPVHSACMLDTTAYFWLDRNAGCVFARAAHSGGYTTDESAYVKLPS